MHKSTINKILYLVLFFLPWQSRYIFSEVLILGDITEYGKLSVYAVEVLLLIVILLRGRPRPIWGSEHVSKSIYILLGAVFFSLTFSNEYNVSLNHVMHLIFAAGLFLTLCDERTDVKNSVIAFVAGLCVPAVLGIIQVFTGLSPSSTLLGMSFLDASTAGVSVVFHQDKVFTAATARTPGNKRKYRDAFTSLLYLRIESKNLSLREFIFLSMHKPSFKK